MHTQNRTILSRLLPLLAGSRFTLAAPRLGALAGAALATLSLGALASAAHADVQNVTPYVVIVAADGADLRAGDSAYHYSVAKLKSGTPLRVDGEGDGWLRVAYPAAARAVVSADDVTPSTDGATLTLRKPSRLSALNSTGGPRASFMPLLAGDLAPNTTLKVLEALKDDAGKTTHYAVAAPEGARGYVSKGTTRAATPDETTSFAKAGAAANPTMPAAAPKIDAPKPTPTPSRAAAPSDPTIPATTPPAATAHTPAANGGVIGSTPNIAQRPTGTPGAETPPGFTPVPDPTAPPDPAAETPAPARVAPTPAPATPYSRAQELVALYERIRTQPSETADLDEAIGAFRAQIGTLTNSGADRALAKRLQWYVSALDARRDLRDQRRAADTASQTIETRVSELHTRILELEGQRIYTVIGRLVPSVVYDGQRLPLLYRIESPEPGSARTLGYLQPDPKLDLTGKLGIVVGIDGEQRFEESLRANIITPRKIDQVSLEPVGERVVKTEKIMDSRTTTTTTRPAPTAPQTTPSAPPAPSALPPRDEPRKPDPKNPPVDLPEMTPVRGGV
ncbi:hypothetical protein BH11PLA1_BH11PLA1_22170 [soil metagenome]